MSFQKRINFGNAPQCVGCERKGIGTAISEKQSAKTAKALNMPLCPRCEKIAAAYVASVRTGKPMARPKLTGTALLMDYDARLGSANSVMSVDRILLELTTDANATAIVIKAVRGLAKRRVGEINAKK